MRAWILAMAFGAALAACAPEAESPPSQGPSAPRMEVLTRHPPGTFLENLTVAEDGSVYYTNYTGKTIERWRAGEGQSTFVALPDHPVSLVALQDGFAIVAHRGSFFDGPSVLGTGRIYRLDKSGAILAEHPAPEAGFLNGSVLMDADTLLIADSASGAIWRHDLDAGTLVPFFASSQLSPQGEPFVPGANGLKLAAGALMISSSAQRAIFRLPLEGGAPAGPLTRAVDGLPGADDFALLPGGGMIVATHGEALIEVSATGEQTVLSRHPAVLGATALAVIGKGADRRVLVLGTGGATIGGKGDASLVSLPL